MKSKLSLIIATSLLSTTFFSTAAYAKDVVVKPGDTLLKYAQEYHTSVQEIKDLNHLSNDLIYTGKTLHITNATTKHKSESTLTYNVKSGDSLSTIASKFNVSIHELKAWNHLSGDMLQIGQTLKVKGSDVRISSYDSGPINLAIKVIDRAKDYIGVPYVWGGTSPRGFDCSGFVKYVFEREGKYLPLRTSQGLFAEGQRVSSLHKGDLVFFTTDSRGTASHVGIYIGHDRFISAIDSGVKISSLGNRYWSSRYLGARSYF